MRQQEPNIVVRGQSRSCQISMTGRAIAKKMQTAARAISILAILCPLFAFGQAARWDYQVTTINQSAPQPGGMYPVLAIPGSAVQICNAPVNAVPCTNYATTYTSATMTTACPSNAQFTRPGSNVCVANADAQGGFGFWSSAGIYQYTVTRCV